MELRPGKEELYRTGDELAAAIRSGEVDGHSRIYHRSTSKWISITLHPQYKAIVSQKVAREAEGSDWMLAPQAETLEGATEPPARLDDIVPDSAERGSEGDPGDSPWRRPLALGISGLFLLFGIQLAFSGPRPHWSTGRADESEIPATATAEQARTEQATSQQVVSLASTSTAWDEEPVVEKPAEPAPAPKAPAGLPKAPRVAMKFPAALPGSSAGEADPRTVDGLLADYGKAYENARGRLGSGMRVARLNQLFAISRLTPGGGVTDTRLGLAGLTNFIRVYREQESSIERMYQDSFTAMSKDLGWSPKVAKRWYSREVGKESPELASLTDRLLAKIDSVLGMLSAEAGAYQLVNGKIHFEDPAAGRQYGDLRRNINAAMDAARIAGGEESEGPMGALLRAIGTTRLPVEG
ncbi:MAG TPA: hypothetical protein VFT28_02610 [Gemmatimonadales bacterium]|nr:hypothetical protein [Gemmatimonadales bacterium]